MKVLRNPPIQLTERERAIFGLLLLVNEQHGLGLTFRVAGGWVRDKLLGRDCHDIDIAIDKMTGGRFVKSFLEPRLGTFAYVVPANPEQSKHLETAAIEINGLMVDFANLRDESFGAYDDNRIPTENRFGSPKQDAERRDLTINALFYNLHTGEVEDYVGGLPDLHFFNGERESESARLVTPLPPIFTFTDDPLRVLRVLRFLARIPGAYLDTEVANSFSNERVQKALVTKVSAERIAVELLGKKEREAYKPGLLSGENFGQSLEVMYAAGILDLILFVPRMNGFASFDMEQHSSHHRYNVFHHSVVVMKELRERPYFQTLPPDRQALLTFAALLHDVGKRDPACTQIRDDGYRSYKGHEDSSAEVARDVCQKLKMSDDDTRYVVQVVEAHMLPTRRAGGIRSACVDSCTATPTSGGT
jgi:tRNA nucleotidyltransferase/poly(A) polymerase